MSTIQLPNFFLEIKYLLHFANNLSCPRCKPSAIHGNIYQSWLSSESSPRTATSKIYWRWSRGTITSIRCLVTRPSFSLKSMAWMVNNAPTQKDDFFLLKTSTWTNFKIHIYSAVQFSKDFSQCFNDLLGCNFVGLLECVIIKDWAS